MKLLDLYLVVNFVYAILSCWNYYFSIDLNWKYVNIYKTFFAYILLLTEMNLMFSGSAVARWSEGEHLPIPHQGWPCQPTANQGARLLSLHGALLVLLVEPTGMLVRPTLEIECSISEKGSTKLSLCVSLMLLQPLDKLLKWTTMISLYYLCVSLIPLHFAI